MKRRSLLSLAVASILVTACQAAERPTAWQRLEAGEFVVFAEVIGVPDKQIADDGLEPITYLYGRFFKPGPNGEPVDLEHLAAECAKLDVPNNIVGIDLEDERVRGLVCGAGPEEWEPHAKTADDVIATIRKVQPEWKLGWFAHVASIEERQFNGFHAHRHSTSQQGQRHREYLAAIEHQRFMASRLGDKVDWLHPSLYVGNWHWIYAHKLPGGLPWQFEVAHGVTSPIYEAQRSPQDAWLDVSHVGLRLMRRTFPRKPIIPAISPQWWTLKAGQEDMSKPANAQFFREEWLVQQLDLLKVHASGVVVWVAPGQDGWEPGAFMRSRRWKLMCEWAEKQKGE